MFTQTSLVILTERSGGRISRWDCATCYARFFTFVQNDKHRGVFTL